MADKTANKVQKRASVHEKTVQAIAKGEVGQEPKRPRRTPQKPIPGFSYMGRVDPLVMAVAQEIIADGSYTKIEVLAEDTVIVR